MSQTGSLNKASVYQQVGVHSRVENAGPHRLIQMLMEGTLDRLAMAKGFIEREDYAGMSKNISMAMSMVDGLRLSLDTSMDEEVIHNLDNLYEYIGRRLLEANAKHDVSILEEVGKLMREIKDGWDAIAPEGE